MSATPTPPSDGDDTVSLRPEDRLLAKGVPRDEVAERNALSRLEARLLGRPEEPIRLARYALLRRLGAGGSGVVYAAFDPELDRQVAIKLLKQRFTVDGESDEGHARLLREAQALARLSHPNVVAVHDVGTYDAREHAHEIPEIEGGGGRGVFIVMEMVEGINLLEWSRGRARTVAETLEVLIAAGRGLSGAHAAGLVHRDVKPSNVVIGATGTGGDRLRVRMLDFGLARSAWAETEISSPSGPASSGASFVLTREGTVLGTPAYMAPEQHRGQPTDARTDQYGFCVMAYELLYGVRPFAGRTVAALARLKVAGNVPQPPDNKHVPAHVRATILRGLNPAAADRYASMDELLALLEAALTRARHPHRARRRLYILGAVGLVGAGGIAFDRLRTQQTIEACTALGDAIGDAWGPSASRGVASSLLATGAGTAQDTVARLQDGLDTYARTWRELRTEACLATDVEGTRSDALHLATAACLEERRAQLEALVGLLSASDVDAGVERRAVQSVIALPRVQRCMDDAWLSQRVRPPADPDARRRVAEVRTDLARARALVAAARFERAENMYSSLDPKAEATGWDPLRAELVAAQGRLSEAKGEYPAAAQRLEDAYLLAGSSGHDDLAASAATELVFVSGARLAEYNDGLRWGRIARMLLTRLDDLGSLREAALLEAVGSIRLARSESDEAETAYAESLAILDDALGPEHPRAARAINALGRVAQQRGKYADAQAYYRRALAIQERAQGPRHPAVASPLGGLAGSLAAAGRHAEAIEAYRRAIEILEAALGSEHPSLAPVLNSVGGVYNNLGDSEKALEVESRALAIREKSLGPDHPDVATALNSLGNLHFARKEYRKALQIHSRALAIWEASLGPDHADLGYSYNNIGNAQLALGAFDDAEAAYRRALTIWSDALGADHPRIGYPLHGLSGVLVRSGRPAEAIPLLQRAIGVRVQAGVARTRIAENRFLLAKALWNSGRDRAGAVELAEQARADFASGNLDNTKVTKWLRAIGRSSPPSSDR